MTLFLSRFFLAIINRNENRIARTVVERKRDLHTITYLSQVHECVILWSPCGWEIEGNEQEQQAVGGLKLLSKTTTPTVWQNFNLGMCIWAIILHTSKNKPFKQNKKIEKGRASEWEVWWKCLWCPKCCLPGDQKIVPSLIHI